VGFTRRVPLFLNYKRAAAQAGLAHSAELSKPDATDISGPQPIDIRCHTSKPLWTMEAVMTAKYLRLLTLDEAIAQSALEAPSHRIPETEKQVNRRPRAPSSQRLPSRTREYVLPPQLLPGPFSIYLR
jgi:hypothetical protein